MYPTFQPNLHEVSPLNDMRNYDIVNMTAVINFYNKVTDKIVSKILFFVNKEQDLGEQ